MTLRLASTLLAAAAFSALAVPVATAEPQPIPSHAELKRLWEGGAWTGEEFHGGGWMSGYKSFAEYANPDFTPPNMVPLKPGPLKRYKEIRKAYGEGRATFAPYAECHPAGMPYLLTMDGYGGYQAIVADDEILFLYGGNHDAVRRIHLRNHVHPDPGRAPPSNSEDPAPSDPTYNGDSIAHWEGDTMVVDTTNIRGEHTQIEPHLPKAEGSRIVERYTPTAPGRFAVEMTMTNPDFTRPWVVRFHIGRDPRGKLIEALCSDGNRWSMGAGGGLTMTGSDGKPLEKAED